MISRSDFQNKDAFLNTLGEALSKGSNTSAVKELMLFASTVPEWADDAQKLYESRVRIEKLLNLSPATDQGSNALMTVLQSTFGWLKYALPVLKNSHMYTGLGSVLIGVLSTYYSMKSGLPLPEGGAKSPDVAKTVEDTVRKLDIPGEVVKQLEASEKLADKIAGKVNKKP